MNIIPSSAFAYVDTVQFTSDLVSVRSTNHPVNSVGPSGGRFGASGEITYYFGSGIHVALWERYGPGVSGVESTDAVYSPPSGSYMLFNLVRYSADHPSEASCYIDPGRSGWASGQLLRSQLTSLGISGVQYPSARYPGGLNVALWPTDGHLLPTSFFCLCDPLAIPYARYPENLDADSSRTPLVSM